MAAAGANIAKLVADNERYAKAEAYATDLLRAGQSAAWHTAQYRPLKCAARRMATYDVDASSQGGAELHHLMAVELKYAAKELVLSRRAKLRTLLDGEKLSYEAELNAMGLAVAKSRF